MPAPPSDEGLLDRVRKLLAKAEAEGVTPPEAEALTGKAAELMARYGIDRARLGALRPETDSPADKVFAVASPWAAAKAYLLSSVASALRCQCIVLTTGRRPGARVHVFGYASDIERADILFTSLLVQMAHGLAAQHVPATAGSPKAWRRSWMLGFATAVTARIGDAEQRAASEADAGDGSAGDGKSTALVLADRDMTIRRNARHAYPRTRRARVTYTGNGYANGYLEGQRADIGGAKLRGGSKALGSS